ncbi:twin-arginine translocase TatA/TatE family subunit [Devosia sp.]|uniref:twin-arginine translocase TatA/TatE family subunit n=1 Tax=Devosia sp. TaxID=1871048 RepID=UPI003A95BFC2
MHAPGIWGIIVVAVVVIVLFGRGKISGLMGEVASGIKSFQKGLKDEDETPKSSPQIDASASAETPRQTEKAKDV